MIICLLKVKGWTIVAAIAFVALAGCRQEKTFGEYYLHGPTWLNQGENDKTISELDRIIREQPDNTAAHMKRAEIKSKLGRYEEALSDLDLAVRLQPDNPAIFQRRADIHLEISQFDAAVSNIDHVVRLRPNDPFSYMTRALFRFQAEQYRATISDLDKVIAMRPDHPLAAYHLRGLAWANLYQPWLALADYDKHIQINPNDAHAYGSRGVAKERLGQHNEALVDYEICLELLDDSPSHSSMRVAVEKRVRELENNRKEERNE